MAWTTAAATPKVRLRRLMAEQPDDSSFDEILTKKLAFAAMVGRGLADSQGGHTSSHEEVGRRVESWRK